MGDRRPARSTRPWTWGGPSSSARSHTRTENRPPAISRSPADSERGPGNQRCPRREVSVASHGRMASLLLEPIRPRGLRHESASIKCCFSAARTRLARNLYQPELPLLQFIHGAWTDAPGRRARIGNWMRHISLQFPVDKTPKLVYMGWKWWKQATL